MKNIKEWMVAWMVMLLPCLSSCEKAPVNGSVEQHWSLEQFTILETGEVVKCSRLFYSITRMVTEVAEKQGTHDYGIYVARTGYRNQETELVLRDFKVRGKTSDSGKDATIEQLKPFGICNPKKTVFRILNSSHKHLTLESDYARLELKKF